MADEAPTGLRAPTLAGPIGPGIDRVDGRLKVTGAAPYAYEYQPAEYDGPRRWSAGSCRPRSPAAASSPSTPPPPSGRPACGWC